MAVPQPRSQNFTFLLSLSAALEKIAGFAEVYLAEDPNGSLTKTRQFAELLAKRVAAKVGVQQGPTENQYDLLKKLENAGAITGGMAQLFHSIRQAGNAAVHGLAGDHDEAETSLRMAHTLAVWYIRAYGGQPTFQAQSFYTPKPPASLTAEKAAEQEQLKADNA